MNEPNRRAADENGRRPREARSTPAPPRAYVELPPPAHLRDEIECFWRREAGATRAQEWVLPDGCLDIIWTSGRDPFIAGPATLPIASTIDGIDMGSEIIGVRFRPGVGGPLLGLDAREVRNQRVLLRDIWSRQRAMPWEAAMSGSMLTAQLDAIARLIAQRLESGDVLDLLVRDAVALIASHPRGSVEEIARRSGLGERQMRRRFDRSVGYGPKTLQRIVRVQRLLWLASANGEPVPNLPRLAFACGYADQAHMTRETVALTGETPRQLLCASRRGSAVSEMFNTALGDRARLIAAASPRSAAMDMRERSFPDAPSARRDWPGSQ